MSFCLWQSRFKYIGIDNFHNQFKDVWVVTEFVSSFNDSILRYVIQPLVSDNVMGEGVTGLHAYIVTEEELNTNFEMTTPPIDNKRSLEILEKCRKDLENMNDEELEIRMREVGLIE